MNTLCIDTSTEILRVGIKTPDSWYENIRSAGFKHGETLIPMVQSLLLEADLFPARLDLIVCTRGPGSFTGLRIGMAAAKGLAEGIGCPLVTLSTLEIYGELYSFHRGLVIPLIDARKNHFYTCTYRNGKAETAELDASVEEILDLSQKENNPLFVGPGAELFYSQIEKTGKFLNFSFNFLPCHSFCNIFNLLGNQKLKKQGGEPPDAGPAYIRLSDAELHIPG